MKTLKEKQADQTLQIASRVLNQLGIKWWISAGTLLGAYRDKGFIRHDTDIDVEILGDEKAEEIIKQLPFARFRTRKTDHYIQLAFIDTERQVVFDIYFFYPDGNELENISEEGRLWYPADKFENLETIKLYGETYPCPNPEWYCEFRYGKDWNIPKTEKNNEWWNEASNLQVAK